ncbi:cob(I)yrinic acid a,c-diamide adenosyltransferase [Alphaproteobacteria bacterium]|nr:cob(I)yrinic acid a,c-diamide adenosyltransferase [Alphaproteobacteria bacterium]
MVKIDKVYTKGGDNGKTSLGDGTRVSKTNKVIIALANIEELNANLGIIICKLPAAYKDIFYKIQNDLFDLGADLITPKKTEGALRINKYYVIRLEKKIDEILLKLSPLKSFILPGGTEISSRIHLARTVCRRCEITILELNKKKAVNFEILKYINRLSDFLFVVARKINVEKNKEVLWKPGQHSKN